MSRVVDYSVLFEDHIPHLRLSYQPYEIRPWRLLDTLRDDQLYAHASTLTQAVRFMRAQARKGDATVDEFSIATYAMLADPWAWSEIQGSGTGPEIGQPGPTGDQEAAPTAHRHRALVVSQTDVDAHGESAPVPDDFSRKVTATVLPFRRPMEPLDEVRG